MDGHLGLNIQVNSVGFSYYNFRKTVSSLETRTVLLVNKNKTQNIFLNQNLEVLALGIHLKLLELKAQHSFTVFIPNKCSMMVAFQWHMGVFSMGILG